MDTRGHLRTVYPQTLPYIMVPEPELAEQIGKENKDVLYWEMD